MRLTGCPAGDLERTQSNFAFAWIRGLISYGSGFKRFSSLFNFVDGCKGRMLNHLIVKIIFPILMSEIAEAPIGN